MPAIDTILAIHNIKSAAYLNTSSCKSGPCTKLGPTQILVHE